MNWQRTNHCTCIVVSRRMLVGHQLDCSHRVAALATAKKTSCHHRSKHVARNYQHVNSTAPRSGLVQRRQSPGRGKVMLISGNARSATRVHWFVTHRFLWLTKGVCQVFHRQSFVLRYFNEQFRGIVNVSHVIRFASREEAF